MDKDSKESKKVDLFAVLRLMEDTSLQILVGTREDIENEDGEGDVAIIPLCLFEKIAGWSPEDEIKLVPITISIGRR